MTDDKLSDQERDQFVFEVAGSPPAEFNRMIADATAANTATCAALGVDMHRDIPDAEAAPLMDRVRDALLLAAYSYTAIRHGGKGEHSLAFITRARQVAKWCTRPLPEPTPLSMLEAKAREIARMVAQRLFHGEEFLLLVMDGGKGGHVTWMSSIEREGAIKLLRETADQMAELQAGLS